MYKSSLAVARQRTIDRQTIKHNTILKVYSKIYNFNTHILKKKKKGRKNHYIDFRVFISIACNIEVEYSYSFNFKIKYKS